MDTPSILEQRDLNAADDSRPDGLMLIPWSRGHSLAWDAAVYDTFATSNVGLACHGAGLVADQAAHRKIRTYSTIMDHHIFMPSAMKTAGVFGEITMSFFWDLGNRPRVITGLPDCFARICLYISVCI